MQSFFTHLIISALNLRYIIYRYQARTSLQGEFDIAPPLKCLRLSKRLGEKKMTPSFLNVDILILIVKQLFQELSTSEITSTIFHLHSVLPTEFSFEDTPDTGLARYDDNFTKPSKCEFFNFTSKM